MSRSNSSQRARCSAAGSRPAARIRSACIWPRGGTDDPQHVAANNELLRAVTSVTPAWISQVHGSDVVDLDLLPAQPVGDAAVATQPDRVAAVRVADCLPVLFCDRDGTRVAAA